MGADRAVLVSDEAAAGSDLVATSTALAKALEREGADLVLFGQQAERLRRRGALGRRRRPPAAARRLAGRGGARRRRQADGEAPDRVRLRHDQAPLPAVVAVSDAINEPRYPSLKGIMGAKKKPQETVARRPGVDGASARGSGTEVFALNEPPPRGESRKIEDDGNAAQAIVDFLAEKRLV